MARKAATIHKAHLQERKNGSFRVYWGPRDKRIFITLPTLEADAAEKMRRAADLWLSGEGNPPAWIENSRAYRKQKKSSGAGSEEILARYKDFLRGDVSLEWADISYRGVLALSEWIGGQGGDLVALTQEQAGLFFDEKLGHLSKETRNRRLSMYLKFYRWGMARGLCNNNPYRDFKAQRGTKKRRKIWFLETEERDAVCREVMTMKNWIAVWIACYAGLRRKEIANLRIEDLKLDHDVIHVQEVKGHLPRVVELNKSLKAKLKQWLKENGGRGGRVVDWPEAKYGWQISSRRMIDTLDEDLQGMRKKKKQKVIESEKIGWNAFRHTFGSLLVQRGASVDYVCEQLGNTSEVARLHYLSFKGEKKNPFVDLL